MLPTSHGIVGYLLYQKSKSKKYKWLAVIGAVLPDAAMIFSLFALFLFNISSVDSISTEVWHNFYHSSDIPVLVSTILHSGVIWLVVLLIGYLVIKTLVPLAIGALSHVVIDLLTHQISGAWGTWNHFYPIPLEPINGIVDFYTVPFFIAIHTIWALIFIPRIIKHYKEKK